MPVFSVVITSFNRSKLVEEAVLSVLNQSYNDFEIIIIDDASTDDSRQVIQKLAGYDQRIRYQFNEINKGSIFSKNYGIKLAKGKFICILDSDDLFAPCKLEELYHIHISNPSALFLYGGWEWKNYDTGVSRILRVPNAETGLINGRERWCFNILPDAVCSDWFKNHLYDENIKSFEQYLVLIELFETGKVAWSSKIISIFRDHSGPRSSGQLQRRIDAIDNIIEAKFGFIKERSRNFLAELYLKKMIYKKVVLNKRDFESVCKVFQFQPFNFILQLKALKNII
jgi:glycosyltransferase involved in cell wall biosynthesis